MKTLSAITLGCDKNRVDCEKMLARLGGSYRIVADPADAEVIIVNTCAFIESARAEAIDTILAAAQYKKDGKCQKLVVTGCLPERYFKELKGEMSEVDAFVGVNSSGILAVIDGLFEGKREDGVSALVCDTFAPRILTTMPHYAYLKIADGCDNFCTYCTIPSIRGRYRSMPEEEVLKEADYLLDAGVKELILVAQDVTRYGKDIAGEYRLLPLLEKLSRKDFSWIRLLYCYPELATKQLIEFIAQTKNAAKYIDIPLQHFDSEVLKRMNRRIDSDGIERLFEMIRSVCPDIAIRTTVMTGFPGETDAQFERLYGFIAKYKPEHTGVFAYSLEDGTPSARLSPQIPDRVKQERAEAIAELNRKNTVLRNGQMLGKTVKVLYEGIDYERGLFVGRTEQNAPEVDESVYFSADFADIGQFYDMKITGTIDDYDLTGEVK